LSRGNFSGFNIEWGPVEMYTQSLHWLYNLDWNMTCGNIVTLSSKYSVVCMQYVLFPSMEYCRIWEGTCSYGTHNCLKDNFTTITNMNKLNDWLAFGNYICTQYYPLHLCILYGIIYLHLPEASTKCRMVWVLHGMFGIRDPTPEDTTSTCGPCIAVLASLGARPGKGGFDQCIFFSKKDMPGFLGKNPPWFVRNRRYIWNFIDS